MAEMSDVALREQLLDRRQRLESVIGGSREHAHLMQLLNDVDSALKRMEAGSYGICEYCHEPIERERLAVDPLLRFCLPHLTPDQQRALEEDLDLASHIQRELLPKQNLNHGGWEVYYHYEAAGPVSGDYCDVVTQETDGGGLFFALGDVSGKGIAASMLMAHLRAIFRMLITGGLPVRQQIERANRVFCESTLSTHFATLVCGRARGSGEVEICNAGHCPPLLVRGGEVTGIEATGLPLGMFCNGQYAVSRFQMSKGDTLLFYTDGLSETVSRSDTEYGAARLSRVVADGHALPPQGLVRACVEDLAAFRSGAPKRDDLTVMAIRRVG